MDTTTIQQTGFKKKSRFAKGLLETGRCWQLYVMLLPAILYMAIFAYRPMGGIVIAFKTFSMRKGIWGSPWCGMDNFARLFTSYWFPIILKNTILLSVMGLVLGFPFPILLALAFNEVKNVRYRKLVQTVSYAPHFISTVVMCGMLILMLSPTSGVINKLLGFFGAEPYFFMQEPVAFKWVYTISGIWQTAGWSSIIYFAALAGVDKSLLEAAEIDGASRMKKVIYINIPVILPTVVIMLILACGQLLSVGYEKVYLLQTPPNLMASEVISTYVYKVGLEQADFSFSTATGLFNSIVNTVILVLANTISKSVGQSGLF